MPKRSMANVCIALAVAAVVAVSTLNDGGVRRILTLNINANVESQDTINDMSKPNRTPNHATQFAARSIKGSNKKKSMAQMSRERLLGNRPGINKRASGSTRGIQRNGGGGGGGAKRNGGAASAGNKPGINKRGGVVNGTGGRGVSGQQRGNKPGINKRTGNRNNKTGAARGKTNRDGRNNTKKRAGRPSNNNNSGMILQSRKDGESIAEMMARTQIKLRNNNSGGSGKKGKQKTRDRLQSPQQPSFTPPLQGNTLFPYTYPKIRYQPWKKLSTYTQTIAQKSLGYDESSWNALEEAGGNGVERTSFGKLSEEEKEGVRVLGMNEDVWNCFVNRKSLRYH